MAAPIIEGSFTADVQTGNPPFDVQFTDTTIVNDGFARFWFWEFGDGTISTEQNPTHTYSGACGLYDVTLTVIATTAEFQSLTKQDKAAEFVSGTKIEGSSSIDEETAWNDRSASDPNDITLTSHSLTIIGGGYSYSTRTTSYLYKTGFNNALHILVLSVSDRTDFRGAFNSSPGGSLAPGVMTIGVDRIEVGLLSLSTSAPVSASTEIVPEERLTGGTDNATRGLSVQPFTRSYYSHSTQSFNDHEESGFIEINCPPVAAFTASPTAGSDPLTVNFTNLSTPATGTPTTYLWKKRKSGSGDSFVSFSTEEHPSETFSK